MIEVSLQGKVAIVTGGVHGIGRAIAVRLAQAGIAGLAVADIAEDVAAEEARQALATLGADVLMIKADVSCEDDWQRVMASTLDRWGRLDILVNNAGIVGSTSLLETTVGQFDRMIAVNLRSVFIGMQQAAHYMKDHGGGSIINMSSIAGITGGSTSPDYSASKAGIIALTKLGSQQLGKYNIRVNAVAPGTIDTVMIRQMYAGLTPEQWQRRLSAIPMNRMGTVDEVAKAVLFLASDLASYVHGHVLTITGGRTA